MGMIRSIIWSSLCVGLGVFLGSHSFSGKTAVEHAEEAINEGRIKPLSFSSSDLDDVVAAAKKRLSPEVSSTERHSSDDRDRVNRIIARRKP